LCVSTFKCQIYAKKNFFFEYLWRNFQKYSLPVTKVT
jgi:hypothetical protein